MTAAAIRGGLLSISFATDILPTMPGIAPPPPETVRAFDRWAEHRHEAIGPATGVRTIADGVVAPLLRILGLQPLRHAPLEAVVRLDAVAAPAAMLPVVIVPWDVDLARAWRDAVLAGIGADARWCVCTNGRALRIYDAQRTWVRAHLELDFDTLGQSAFAQLVLWNVLSREAVAASPPRIDRLVDASARHGSDICRALGQGVLSALHQLVDAFGRARGSERPDELFEQSLTVIYRILFLLFAEARGLVPTWHPVYRDRYTIDSIVTTLLSGRPHRGTWAALLAISKLAHTGCDAGPLKVTAFNGRLFSPARTPAFDRRRIDDGVMGDAVLAVSTTPGRGGRSRIQYRDLDVEQLGAVYEQVLEYRPGERHGAPLSRDRETRKATGTFYTPRQVTAHMVRETLAPLVAGRRAEEILALRVLDPAMGSGAFLVATLRYLAGTVEDAFIAQGTWHPGDVTAADRAALRRVIAQRCLFGVDLNPVAVQLARLSLWLATLASGKPLTFLDHHLVTGNTLVGATLDDVARQAGAAATRRGRPAPLPLFDGEGLAGALRGAGDTRIALASRADDSAAIVREKERTLAALHSADSDLGRWTQLLDLWCSSWFLPRGRRPSRALFGDLTQFVLRRASSLPGKAAAPILEEARAAASANGFLHWPLAFPEVFTAPAAGFDAIVGNPPWDMVRGDSGDQQSRSGRREAAGHLAAFVRESGVYRIEARSHLNRYALFTERALQLVRHGGRIGLVLPGGVVSDVGTAPLRRHLFDHARVDAVIGLDNRAGIFPIHRSVRFVLLTATTGSTTDVLSCRFGVSNPEELDRPADGARGPLLITRRLLSRVSGDDDLGLPELLGEEDLRVVEEITARVPCLGAPDGWHLRFSRELNATDDRSSFIARSSARDGRPVLEGKQVTPFRVDVSRSHHVLAPGTRLTVPRRARLAYRDVAGATNRLTLIAAVIPPHAVTTHTLFCLKTPLPLDAQHALCGLMNSFVANYLVRLRVNTHVTIALISRLRVPVVAPGSGGFNRLATLSRALADATHFVEEMPEYVELQALAARLYGVSAAHLAHILTRFPLIPSELREAVLAEFRNARP